MTKINNLFPQVGAYDQAPMVNYEGAPAFVRSDEERCLQVLMTGNAEPTFYASAQELADEAIAVIRNMAALNPEFLTRATIYARSEGHMRLLPIMSLVVLNALPDKQWSKAAFDRVILTPGDLQDYMALILTRRFRGMGISALEPVRQWLAQMPEYHAIKYGSGKQAISLRDIYRLAHPKLEGKAQAIAQYVVKGETASVDDIELPQIVAFERLKQTKDEDEAIRLISEGRLPHEVVTSIAPSTKRVWTAIMHQLPYMALLRNLNTLYRHGVMDNQNNVDYICSVLANPERVQRSRQFPFRFLSAHKAFEGKNPQIAESLIDALEASFSNMPSIGGTVLVANDISVSMTTAVSERSSMTCYEIAAILAAAIYKNAERGHVVSFNQVAHPRSLSRRDSIMGLANQIASGGGGTDLSAPLLWMVNSSIPFDAAVFVTDNESWVDHLTRSRGILDEIRAYRQKHNPNLKCFFLQLLPYETAQVPPDEPGCWYLYGWSDSVVRFIGDIATGGQDQLDMVNALVL